jgi:hypothetical protein
MSLICGALSWLTKNTDQTGLLLSKDQNDLNEAGNKENAEPDWLQSYGRNNLELERKEQERKAKEALLSVEDIRKETLAQKKKRKISYTYHHHEHKRTQMGYKSSRLNKAKSELSVKKDDSNDEEHLVDEYDSDPSSKLYSDDSEEDKKTEKKKWKQEEKETFGIIKVSDEIQFISMRYFIIPYYNRSSIAVVHIHKFLNSFVKSNIQVLEIVFDVSP